MGAGAYFLSAFNKKRRLTSTEKRQGKIFVADTCPLGNRQYLVVAQYGNEKHLLGVSTSSINHLSKLGSIPLTDIDSENQSSDENKVL